MREGNKKKVQGHASGIVDWKKKMRKRHLIEFFLIKKTILTLDRKYL
jgi:hypothetical protein